jgi:urate oxidase
LLISFLLAQISSCCGFESSYSSKPGSYQKQWEAVKSVLTDTFFGPPRTGVYSPSVQNTLFLMAKAVLNRYMLLLLPVRVTTASVFMYVDFLTLQCLNILL